MRNTNDPFGQAEVNSRLIAGMTLKMVFQYICIGIILAFWVGPVLLPWLTQIVTIIWVN